MDSEKPAAIRLSGDKILEEHCHFDNMDGKVTIQCMPDSITVRGALLHNPFFPPQETYKQFQPQFLNGKRIAPGQASLLSFELWTSLKC